MKLTAEPLREGAIPEAMQWKKAAIFAAASIESPDFLGWLKTVPDGLDAVKAKAWDTVSPRQPDLFVLYGWSTSGADELRRATIDSVIAKGANVDVYVSRPIIDAGSGLMGTADMQFVGWKIPVSSLAAGQYSARLHERRDTVKITTRPAFKEEKVAGRGYQRVADLKFFILSVK